MPEQLKLPLEERSSLMPDRSESAIIVPAKRSSSESIREEKLSDPEVSEERRRAFEECLRSLDEDIPKEPKRIPIPTYTEMLSGLPPETQKTIRRSFTQKSALAGAIRGSYNRLLQNQQYGITEPPTLPVVKTLWKRRRPPSTDFKTRAAGDDTLTS